MPQIRPNAAIDRGFQDGVPGTYEILVTIESVPFNAPKVQNFDPARWTQSFRAAGYENVTATRVRFVSSTNARDTNPAMTAMYALVGKDPPPEQFVADVQYAVTVTVRASGAQLAGLGAVQVGWGLGLAILAAAAVVFTAIEYFSGKNVLVDAVKAIGRAVGELVLEGAKGLGAGVLILGVAGAAAIFLVKKAGGRVRTKHVSF